MNASLPPVLVPQADPGASYRAQKAEIDAAIARALASGWYILGRECAAFETEFAAWQGAKRAVGVANGTDALALILRGLGIGPGDSVVTVSHTAVATVAAIEMVGAVPILVDIEPDTYTMDPAELEAVLAAPPPGFRRSAPSSPCISTVSRRRSRRSSRSPTAMAWRLSRTARRATARGWASGRAGRSGGRPPSACIRRRTWARSAMAACSQPTTRRWPSGSPRFASMAGASATSPTSRA